MNPWSDPLETVALRTTAIPAFWPAAQVRRTSVLAFGQNLGTGRIHFCRALQSPEGGDGKAVETQNKKQLLSQLLFVLVETTELESVTFRV